jgi:hypothetical protein
VTDDAITPAEDLNFDDLMGAAVVAERKGNLVEQVRLLRLALHAVVGGSELVYVGPGDDA